MSKKCGDCRYFATTGSSSVCTLYCSGTSEEECCRNHEAKTLFDQLTASREAFADKLVYAVHYGGLYFWHSTLIYPAFPFETKEKAIAATLEELKKEVARLEEVAK